jgi:signal transduction histidine kinase
LTFSFAAMDFSDPGQVRYVYRLEGFEHEWINAGARRDVRYTNLNDGEYLFRVRATNADGILGTKELLVRVVIIPPVWKRWWFIVSIFLLLAGAAAGIIRWYFSRKIKKQLERYERERERLEERMKTRDKIARDLHDDLASTVGSAGFYVETAKRTLTENSAQSREYLEKTSAILIEAEEAMSDIVWSVSPKNDTVQSLTTRIRVVTADLCRANGIGSAVDVQGNGDIPLSDDVRRGFYLIFKEVLNNALKHSRASMITLFITSENDRLMLRIQDNGSGFDPSLQTESLGGNGMQNIRKRADEIRAELRIDSVIGSGTSVTVEKELTHLGH